MINFQDPNWLRDLLLYIASAWIAWLLAQAKVNGGPPTDRSR